MIDWIDAAHRFLAGLFFDDMRDQSGRARDHENAVECGRVHSQIGQNRADSAVHIDGKRFFRLGERFLNYSCRLHVHAVHAGFPREFEQARSAWVFRVKTVTEAGHSFASFPHRCQRARSGFID